MFWVGFTAQVDRIHSLKVKYVNYEFNEMMHRNFMYMTEFFNHITSITLLKVHIKHWVCWTSHHDVSFDIGENTDVRT